MKLKYIDDAKLVSYIMQLFGELGREQSVEKVERYLDDELDKVYDAYLVTTSTGQHYIFKKLEEVQEKLIYQYAFENQDYPVPKQYGMLEVIEDNQKVGYMLMEYIKGEDLRKANEEELKLSVKHLAKIHRAFLNKKLDIVVDYDDETRLEKIIKRDLLALSKESEPLFQKFYKVYRLYVERYMEAPKTLNHGDLLPINVLAGEDGVKIIDWACGHIGAYMQDIARLLCHEVKEGEYFIPTQYHETLEKLYYEEMCKHLDFQVSYEQYKMDIQLAKFQEKSYYFIWTLRQPKEEQDEEIYQLSLEESIRLADEILR